MRAYFNLGEWIREKWKTQAVFAEKLGVTQGRVSKWLTAAEGVSADYQAKIRKLGYQGPWPAEEAQEPAPPTGGPYITEKDAARELGKLEGRIETLEKRLEEALEQLRDLYLRGPKESRPQEPPR